MRLYKDILYNQYSESVCYTTVYVDINRVQKIQLRNSSIIYAYFYMIVCCILLCVYCRVLFIVE